jgi:hypothetical protein
MEWVVYNDGRNTSFLSGGNKYVLGKESLSTALFADQQCSRRLGPIQECVQDSVRLLDYITVDLSIDLEIIHCF